MRILHMFTNPHLTNGATVFEYRVSERLKYDNIFFDYLVTEEATKEELERYEKVGSRVFKLPIDNSHGLLIREIKINYQYYKFFKENNYDIVYADTENALRSIHLLMARLAGVNIRVVHSHNTGLQSTSKVSKFIARVLRKFFLVSATDYFACSDLAAEWLFPARIYKNKTYKILKNGIDLNDFSFNSAVRDKIRKELRISDNNLLIGNVGRFMAQKNHKYLIDIFDQVLKVNSNARLIIIGNGDLKKEIEEYARVKDIYRYIFFIGNVENVNEYLQAMDVFVMPSLFEGLPITGIESQAAGLPCIFSSKITRELKITDLAQYLSIDEEPIIWAEKIMEISSQNSRRNMSNQIIRAGYSIDTTIDILRKFYNDNFNNK